MTTASTRRLGILPPRAAVLAALSAAGLAPAAFGQAPQVIFGIDFVGNTISVPDSSTLTPITESDLMRAPFGQPTFGPMPAPAIVLRGSDLGLTAYSSCVGHAPGLACGIEVDAISFGTDATFKPTGAAAPARLFFSVNRFAVGNASSGVAPNVRSEGALGSNEAAADVFTTVTPISGPLPPSPTPGHNTGVFDGNGLASSTGQLYRGLGLREPPQAGPFDDLDTLHVGVVPTATGSAVYFSLDPQSSTVQGLPPSAVLKRVYTGGGGPISVYATPQQLGLTPFADDLDALILAENGDGVYQPSLVPFDWLTGTTDMLLFSVRVGSSVIGQTDSLFGLPIEPGDVLMPPASAGQRPRLFMAAEDLGLRTARTDGVPEGDEVDALSSAREPFTDCNNNGRDDAQDIALGFSSDMNNNNIPDECEQDYHRYCYCTPAVAPCGNDDAAAGCKNSLGVGALLSGSGTTSVTTDDLVLSATSMTSGTPSLFFRGPNQINVTFGDGLRCVGNPTYRMAIVIANGAGTANYGPGIVANSLPGGPPGSITVGSTWNFQVWYRDSANYCTPSTFNLTNGLTVAYSP